MGAIPYTRTDGRQWRSKGLFAPKYLSILTTGYWIVHKPKYCEGR